MTTPLFAKTKGTITAALAMLGLAACTQPAPEPTPAPIPTPTFAPPAPPEPEPTAPIVTELPTPTYDNWMDAPATPGDWTFAADPGETLALFGPAGANPLVIIRCDLATRRVGIGRSATASGQVSMRVRTETGDRVLTGTAMADRGLIIHEFAASDNFLDAIAFSRGRFALETGGLPTLYVPAYPEITRVVEDCR